MASRNMHRIAGVNILALALAWAAPAAHADLSLIDLNGGPETTQIPAGQLVPPTRFNFPSFKLH